jgi:ribosomal protein L1
LLFKIPIAHASMEAKEIIRNRGKAMKRVVEAIKKNPKHEFDT